MTRSFILLHTIYLVLCLLTEARGVISSQILIGDLFISESNWSHSNIIDSRRFFDDDCKEVLRIRGGGQKDLNQPDVELVLGKDRELVYFSVDLKWVWSKLIDKKTYVDCLRCAWGGIKDLAGVVDSSQEFKEIAIELLQYIRSIDSESPIKLFAGNIKQAELLAVNTGRLILIYIEDGNVDSPSLKSMECRNCLSSQVLGKLINDEV
jgi:hypothetical protein